MPQQISILNKRIRRQLCLYQLALRSMQDLDLLQDQFPGVHISTYLYPASNTHYFFQITFNIFITTPYWLSKGIFPSVIFLNTFFTVLSSYDDQQHMKNFEEVSKEKHICVFPGLKYKNN